MYYTTVRMGDRNYAGIADRYNRKSDWHQIARLNNFKMVRTGDKVKIPDAWVVNKVPAMFQGQVAGIPNRFQGPARRQFGVNQAADTPPAVTQEDCLTAMDDMKTTSNPMYIALVDKFGQESADKRWDIIARAACSDNEMMIHIPWLLLIGSAVVGTALGVGATIGTMKLMED